MESITSEILDLWGSFFFLQNIVDSRVDYNVDSKNAKKKTKPQQNIFGFLDNCIWIGNGKLSLLLQEYL